MHETPVHAWQSMYPPLARHAQGWLDVGDGHAMHWQTCGHPLGMPALFVHGGPGAGCSLDDRRWFDPARYRIVLFDQRGAGRSLPSGALADNTTAHLLRDMEALRLQLAIDRWLIFGGSWGATLALAYAQAHPQRVSALVLRGVFTATVRKARALYGEQAAAWSADIEQRLHGADECVCHAAALEWAAWEDDLMSEPAGEGARSNPALLAMARIGVHYARQTWFLDEAQLLRDAHRLRDLPGVMVQGGRDRVTPPAAGLALHQAWPGSQWRQVDGAGHPSRHPEVARQLIAATDTFADTFADRPQDPRRRA